ncbi:MAG: Uncharacterised protein [Rhodobiaceae bacterium UBA7378]|nr:MAG: Uncharacterised protein [Rhodobiaceae bacterium UBA7378]|tara:strand:- start:2437 stop:2961 length:525 start_codon:yes stop_codon:yes gene_type:complete
MTQKLDYQNMTHNAMMGIVRDALESVATDGLPGEHHFYITFAPQHPTVEIPDDLRVKQSDEMTIVLQHQFENLSVSDTGFSVDLAFDGTVRTLRIPFATVLAFFDPSVEFGLRFPSNQERMLASAKPAAPKNGEETTDADAADGPSGEAADGDNSDAETPKTGEVVSLDTFRDK